MEILERTIKALSVKRLQEGQIGFLTTHPDEEKLWRNVYGEIEVLEEMMKNVIAKGNRFTFEYNNGVVGTITLVEKAPEEQKSDSQYQTKKVIARDAEYDAVYVNIKGKEYIVYDSLIKIANQAGLKSFEILEDNSNEEMTKACIKVRAHVEIDGAMRYFDGIGTSTPDNTNTMTSDHPIEMAHTRAKGRALRDFLSLGEAMAEELKKQ